jgi:hypothetical protein
LQAAIGGVPDFAEATGCVVGVAEAAAVGEGAAEAAAAAVEGFAGVVGAVPGPALAGLAELADEVGVGGPWAIAGLAVVVDLAVFALDDDEAGDAGVETDFVVVPPAVSERARRCAEGVVGVLAVVVADEVEW